ncbi:hypothetical protein [Pseudonocardia spirodelae]|uniref:Uncharacterized protein n=1 Tax=Pseudonocardia spirodelae TaxID=3133431 RepID=A0ABU8T2K0_9PSEU
MGEGEPAAQEAIHASMAAPAATAELPGGRHGRRDAEQTAEMPRLR